VLTQCPGCQTVFRVTGAILKVAHGQVRCGRCSTQFDALEHMLPDEVEEQLQDSAPPLEQEPAASEQIVVEEPQTHEEITLEGKHIEISGVYRVLDDADPELSHTRTIVEEFDFNDGEQELADLNDAEPGPSPTTDNESVDTQVTESDLSGLHAVRRALAAAQEETHPDPEPFLTTAEQPASAHKVLWGAASVLFILVLVAQVIHHYRQDLARDPRLGPALISTYAALRLPLTPNWDLRAYDVQQWGIVSDPNAPGTLRVRAGITNKGSFAQPYPLLKLVLEDRWGGEIGSREFDPREYLPATASADRMLAPRQAANAEIAIVDPGDDAVGFHVDVCLRRENGIACASEQSAG
jgi:predicted Zn finger-like uncharacterized protein